MFSFLIFSALLASTIGGLVPESEEYVYRIVGGRNTTIEKFPYQVSLRYAGEHICGGSILARRKILTAAHCCVFPISHFSIQYGVTNRLSKKNVIAVEKIFIHPDYNATTLDKDVSVLILSDDIVFSALAKPIELATKEAKAGTKAVVLGWGRIGTNGPTSLILQEVDAPIIGRDTCESIYKKLNMSIFKSMICAGVLKGGKDACEGDSGGPLVADGKQVGIVSWGLSICALQGYPAVYANVATLHKWIKSIK